MPLSGQGHGAPTPADPLLTELLDRAVPIAIDLRSQTPDTASAEQARMWRTATASRLAAYGDTVRYGGRYVADTAGALVIALAVLATAPGGVSVFGRHWCTDHAVCEGAAKEAQDRMRAA